MDEILIGEKKYVSSKRAAKMTGYAKDYIGQLCREGRVPARLVGRSWYVLETAIQDHRFSDEKVAKEVKAPAASLHQETWESPQYETVPAESLPPVSRLHTSVDTQDLHDTWKAWFDRVGAPTPEVETSNVGEVVPQELEAEEENQEEINVPVRAIYNQLPVELRPHHRAPLQSVEVEEELVEEVQSTNVRRGYILPIQMAGALSALIFAVLAVAGSGYFDKYIISHSQVGIMAGVILYNR